jgi:hypothetical protein
VEFVPTFWWAGVAGPAIFMTGCAHGTLAINAAMFAIMQRGNHL